jgi:hypothetical protein
MSLLLPLLRACEAQAGSAFQKVTLLQHLSR